MKIRLPSALLVAAALLCGCSTTKFTEYHGTEVFQGKGGEPRDVDGMEFWDDGEPARKFKILGVITHSRGERLPLGRLSRIFSSPSSEDDREAKIAKAARKQDGDAVIILSGDEGSSDEGDDGGGSRHGHRRYVVVKYLE
jgi:hypothetical protein